MSGPSDPKTTDSSSNPSRRSVLRAIGVGSGVTMLGGVASANPGDRGRGGPRGQKGGNSADPKAACGECAEGFRYQKIDGAPEVGDEYTLATGVTITITDVAKNDDGEVVGIRYETDGFVDKICIKGGPVTEVYVSGDDFTGNGEDQWFYAADNPNSGKRYQISNVAYCTGPGVRYQADLVSGYPICEFDQDASPPVTYTAQGRRLSSNGAVFNVEGVTDASCTTVDPTPFLDTAEDCFTTSSSSFHECLPTETGFEGRFVGRDPSCGPDPFVVTLAVYRVPAGAAVSDLDQQVLVACRSVELGGVTSGTISVDLTDGCVFP